MSRPLRNGPGRPQPSGAPPDDDHVRRSHRSPDSVRVAEAMHRGLVCCAPEARVGTIARLLAGHRIHAVAVASEDDAEARLVSDLALLGAVGEGRYDATAAELASPTPLRVRLDDSVAAAARLMSESAVSHVLVVMPGSDRVVGILSSLDVAEIVAQPP